MAELNLASVLSCPECGHSKQEIMPAAACQFFYECESCRTTCVRSRETAVCSAPMER
jgi:transposase-like protein